MFDVQNSERLDYVIFLALGSASPQLGDVQLSDVLRPLGAMLLVVGARFVAQCWEWRGYISYPTAEVH